MKTFGQQLLSCLFPCSENENDTAGQQNQNSSAASAAHVQKITKISEFLLFTAINFQIFDFKW